MLVTQKCQYALRAVLALAKHNGRGPIKIAQIAEEQAIPFRFLEVILSQLKQGGFVESRRGTEGGYMMARKPSNISVGDVVEFIDGPIHQVEGGPWGPIGKDGLAEVWTQAGTALLNVLHGISFADLKAREESLSNRFAPNYQI